MVWIFCACHVDFFTYDLQLACGIHRSYNHISHLQFQIRNILLALPLLLSNSVGVDGFTSLNLQPFVRRLFTQRGDTLARPPKVSWKWKTTSSGKVCGFLCSGG